MLVRDIMTSPAFITGPDDGVADAVRLLDRRSLTTLPVIDQERRLVGILSEADVIGHWSVPEDETHGRVEAPRVRDVMTHHVLTAHADDDVTEVIALMSGTALKSLPVLLNDRVVGVVSRRDVVRLMARDASCV